MAVNHCSYCGKPGHRWFNCPKKGEDESFTKSAITIAIETCVCSVIGGLFMIAREIIKSGSLTTDFSSGFRIGLLVGAGVGFGFGVVYMIKAKLSKN